ncbi:MULTISPECIES: Rpn family recombination-promoting nuclease/putative transposase [unclassified Butyrivibrio]|uniref:Rpn family recombination-promoting nuclease/putative transposase n=1 Tax=unclassified Butyrivibrio TaxID=2639466 RepID=UPI0003B6726F|nr:MULTISPECIES: Rpn family recombination-promoting nuclease/putative transposase [unclassified Butyrivibrio]SDB33688.1 conserved hypothetical protein (putative transposase or invertase) [Butyrivibrio sp. INlla16]SEL69405.1 conserved hypothetical protein (putative transposase or invertase) [Butyrivibrio sp. ob235]
MIKDLEEYEHLTITNNFIFCKIMQYYPDLCKELVELILNRKIGSIVKNDSEHTIETSPDGKGVRLDVYFEDDLSCMYDIEMQVIDNKDLPRRSRFYQSIIDNRDLEKGYDYTQLRDSYVIFICPFNIFDEYGYHIYTFQARAKENTNIILEDGTSKVFVCAKGCSDDVSENMKLFLDYLSGELSDNNLVRKLDDAVKFARKSKEWRAEYMLTQQDKLIMQHEYEALLSEKDEALAEKNEALAEKDKAIAEKNAEIARLKALLDKKE